MKSASTIAGRTQWTLFIFKKKCVTLNNEWGEIHAQNYYVKGEFHPQSSGLLLALTHQKLCKSTINGSS